MEQINEEKILEAVKMFEELENNIPGIRIQYLIGFEFIHFSIHLTDYKERFQVKKTIKEFNEMNLEKFKEEIESKTQNRLKFLKGAKEDGFR